MKKSKKKHSQTTLEVVIGIAVILGLATPIYRKAKGADDEKIDSKI